MVFFFQILANIVSLFWLFQHKFSGTNGRSPNKFPWVSIIQVKIVQCGRRPPKCCTFLAQNGGFIAILTQKSKKQDKAGHLKKQDKKQDIAKKQDCPSESRTSGNPECGPPWNKGPCRANEKSAEPTSQHRMHRYFDPRFHIHKVFENIMTEIF